MKQFVDRHEDMATLEEQYAAEEASFVVIYGRRRVGKTALISKFLEGKRGLYFLATEESEEQNRTSFRQQVAAFVDDEVLASASVESWDVLFDRLTQSGERLVVALDEFQHLGKANAAFPSVFQRIWDTLLSKRNVMVILCGSLISLMMSQALSYDSPLYGRRTAQIHMRQVPFRFYQDFFDRDLDQRQLLERYSITGGVPKYVERFRGTGSIYQLISKQVLNRNSFLFDEPNFLLSKEVVEVGTYFSIIKAIAAGNHRSGEVAAAMNVRQTSLTRYLRALEGLDVLERVVPVTEANPEKSKKGLYRIKDNYLRFWFRFVFPNLGLLETGHADQVLAQIERNLVDGHVAYVFEDVCRQKTWDLAARGELPFVPARIGGWWGAGGVELDVVAVDAEGARVAFGECKLWQGPVGENVLAQLEEKAERALADRSFKGYGEARVTYLIFGLSGFTDGLREAAERRGDVLLVGSV